MLSLPKPTEVQKPLPKVQIYRKFQLTNAQVSKFDSDISRIEIVNDVSTRTIPSILEGKKVKGFYVLSVMLKTKNYEPKNIEKIAKLIPQNLVFALQYEEQVQLAVFYGKLFVSKWKNMQDAVLALNGLDFDKVWENIVKSVELEMRSEKLNAWDDNLSLDENIELHEKKEKLQKEIDKLEKLARKEVQPKRKHEFFTRLQELRRELEEMK